MEAVITALVPELATMIAHHFGHVDNRVVINAILRVGIAAAFTEVSDRDALDVTARRLRATCEAHISQAVLIKAAMLKGAPQS